MINDCLEINILTIFPNMFKGPFSESILNKAQEKGLIKINLIDLRDFTLDKHKTVDDYSYGGGPGMVLKPQPIWDAVEVIKKNKFSLPLKIIITSAQGKIFNQGMAKGLSKENRLLIICGRYEGIDERIPQLLDAEEVSVGNFVVSGGELPDVQPGDQVHFLALSARSGGRIVIEDYWYEDVPDFVKRMSIWYECNMLYKDDVPTYAGMWSSIRALGLPKVKKGYSESQCFAYRQLQSSLIQGSALPSSFKRHAVRAMRSIAYKGENLNHFRGKDSPFRLFRACRVIEGVQYEKGGFIMQEQNAAYHLGKLVVEMDDAKQSFDNKNHKTRRQFDLTPTGKDIFKACELNPRHGLACIQKKLEVFDPRMIVCTADGRFSNLPRVFSPDDGDNFMAGFSAGIAARHARIVAACEKKAQKKLEQSNAAACEKAV